MPSVIMFPKCRFTLIDSIGKKVRVAQDVAEKTGLDNVICRHERAEDEKQLFEFVISRGVMPLYDLCSLAGRLIDHNNQRNAYPNGVICLKGGDLGTETAKFRKVTEITDINSFFKEDYFKDKKTVYVQI